MTNFSHLCAGLRRKNWRQYTLLFGCCFFSVLLITAYGCMMRAPTILEILPEGGDSRKQVTMIFVLAVIGCGLFSAYAAGLFFRYKSRETGIFLALGATRQQLKQELWKELALLAGLACGLGTRMLRRTNVMDIIRETHTSEMVRAVPLWYGWVGICLLAAGGFSGYIMPGVFVTVFHWYAPSAFTALFYLPALVGLYMMLLHTVVNGWGRKRRRDLVAVSMMKFQGRQTVRNMLVMTVLIAGAYFASFYIPMLGTGSAHGYESRPVDYAYHWRADQPLPQREEVELLARQCGVEISTWAMEPAAVLGIDGMAHLETETGFGITYTEEYCPLLTSASFLSESSYHALTGQAVDLASGTVAGILDDEGSGLGIFGGSATRLTNMVTGQTMDVTPVEPLQYTMLFGRFVLDDKDYAQITQGLSDLWRENQVFFNVENCDETYDFAKTLFHTIVARSGPEVEQFDVYDPVEERLAREAGETYAYTRDHLEEAGYAAIDYDEMDSSHFRLYWKYMPQFRVMDQADFVKTAAVFLMLFLFIAIVCFAAVFVIAFTRCITIALTNARVYNDLKRLGAPRSYLYRSIKTQVRRVFLVPALVGTTLIYAFYTMILYFNSDPPAITYSEGLGLLACLAVVAAVSLLLYWVYRLTLGKVCRLILDGA